MSDALGVSSWAEESIDNIAAAQAAVVDLGKNDTRGFAEISAAAPAPSPSPLAYVAADENETWFNHVNTLEATVGALGCHALHDCSLHRHGILFHGDTLLTDASHLGGVARQEGQAMSANDRTSTMEIAMDRPALVFLAPGFRIYGHWLVDFLPRMRIARQALGGTFHDHLIPIPATTPNWAIQMLMEICGVFEDQLLPFDPATHHITFRNGSVPTYGHASYHFHPDTAAYWPRVSAERRQRRLCISRLNFEGRTDGVLKSYIDRQAFEQMATDRGYELIYPETLSIRAQIDLFGEASHVVGEYGSALHSMLFAPEDAVVGAIRCPNDVQLRISALKRQKTVIGIPEKDWVDDAGAQCYSTSPEMLDRFFSAMDDV